MALIPHDDNPLPLFQRATRRAVLQRGLAAAGVLAAGAWLAACGNDDTSALSTATTNQPSTTPATTTHATQAPVTTGSGSATGADAVSVAFSYTSSDSSGRVRNPYIASWVEDASGAMVAVISVWYSAKDAKYLRELTEFTAASADVASSSFDAASGATRTAGDYELHWDGIGLDGTALTGAHTIWIEAAREHGPHSVTSGPVTLGTPGTATLPANGELSAATVTVA